MQNSGGNIEQNSMAMFMQEMMQLFMKHHNLNDVANRSDVNNILLKHLGAAAAEYLAQQEKKVIDKKIKQSSFDRSVKHRVKGLVKFLGADKLVCDIKEVDAERFINSKNEKPYEREQLRKLTRKMFDFFVMKFYTLSNPFSNIEKQKIQRGEIVLIDNNHLIQIIDFIRNEYTKEKAELIIDVITLLVNTALRPGELLSLVKRNVLIVPKEERANLQLTSTKNYKTRIVPAVGEAYKIITKYYNQTKGFDDYLFPGRILRSKQDHLKIDTVSKAFKHACKELKLPSNYCLYALRATCASALYTKGLPLQEISRFLGHSNTQITESYYSRFNSVNNENLISILRESELNQKVKNKKLRKVV